MANQMEYAYNSRVARINLSKREALTEQIDELFCREYIGGAGFVTYFLLKELRPYVDALSPDNKIVFGLGPLTAANMPGGDRFCVGTKSPMTGGLAKSESGGYWGTELKRAGFDALIVEGKSETPVYVWIHDGQIEIRDAKHLWGKTTKETQEAIITELGDKSIRVVLIGPGGENMVRYACVMSGLKDAAGRGGIGAVMGSKNLKAIAVRGHNSPPIYNPEALKEIRQWLLSNMDEVRVWHELGTGADMVKYESVGNLPVRNYRDGVFPGASKIDSQTMKATLGMTMEGCFACPVRCKKVVKIEEPYIVDPAYGAPEYETLGALGSNCGIDNLKAICKGNELCEAYSIDTISTGNTIAFAMECFERGLITQKDTGGIELKFGNHEAMLKMIELIARREGLGDLLSLGTARAAKEIGQGAEKFAQQVKGLETAQHDPRYRPMIGLGYMVAPNGADHCMGIMDDSLKGKARIRDLTAAGMLRPFTMEEIGPRKVAAFRTLQNKRILSDSLLVCAFMPFSLEHLAQAVKAVTGWETTSLEQQRVADRIQTAARLFIARDGFTAKDDVLPERFFHPKTDGALSNRAVDFEVMEKAKRYYYRLMGWDIETGIPTPERLEDLSIQFDK